MSNADIDQYCYRAQYDQGTIKQQAVPAYLQENGIDPQSTTETFAAVRFHIDNWRWQGVPFYVRTGKRLKAKQSLISICFKKTPSRFFRQFENQIKNPNWLLLSIQPEQHIRMEMTVKEPGLDMRVEQTSMDAGFQQKDPKRDAYDDLLLDVFEGEQSLYLSREEIHTAWEICDPILKAWQASNKPLDQYESGSWGPLNMRKLFHDKQLVWRHTLDSQDTGWSINSDSK